MWAYAAISAAALFGTGNVILDWLSKKESGTVSSRKLEPPQMLTIWAIGHSVLAAFLTPSSGRVPDNFAVLLAIGAIHVVCILSLYQGFQDADVTLIGPLQLLAPVSMLGFCFAFLGEKMQTGHALAFVIVISGALVLTAVPNPRKYAWGKAVRMMIVSGLAFGAYATLFRSQIRGESLAAMLGSFGWSRLGIPLAYGALCLRRQFRESVRGIVRLERRQLWIGVGNELLDMVGIQLVMVAVATAPSGAIASGLIHPLIPGFAFVWIWILRNQPELEGRGDHFRRKAVGLALTASGVALALLM